MTETSLRNHLLVSPADSGDENFERTVVYVIDHDPAGAIGVVLNDPLEAAPEGIAVSPPLATPAKLFRGGPVSPDAVVVLGRQRLGAGPHAAMRVGGPVVVLTADEVGADDTGDIDVVRMYAGYAGWGPGQLDSELAGGAWVVARALPDDVFCSDPGTLWRSILLRQGGRVGALAHFPDDPSVN